MPCDSGPSYYDSDRDEIKSELDTVTRLLCSVCTALEASDDREVVARITLAADSDLPTWWARHRREDEERLAQEEQARKQRRAELKQRARKLADEIADIEEELGE